MRLHVVMALVLFALGAFGTLEWLRDLWRSRTDDAIDRHPRARQLHALAHTIEPPPLNEVLAERLRTRQVVAEADLFDIEAATAGEQGRCEGRD